jgi:hypothetical protein
MSPHESPLANLPSPVVVHERMGRLYRELTLLRRLLRLSQATQLENEHPMKDGREAMSAGRN